MPRPGVIRPTYQCQYSDCHYTFKSRRDSPPARCPNCQRRNWLHGDRAAAALQINLLQQPEASEIPSRIEPKKGEAQ